ncbi:MAG: M43 family zinc metalloprotease [Bacteroidia bacterium]
MRWIMGMIGALIWAQAHRCGTDEYFTLQGEEAAAERERLDAFILAYLQEVAQTHTRTQGSCPTSNYILPVVVHVVHSGAGQPDSIPMNRILWQMKRLFEDYRHQPGTKGYGSGVDTRIEFSLATKDPNGNPHPGVTYNHWQSLGLNDNVHDMVTEDGQLKSAVGWPRNKYVNIWLIRRICGGSCPCSSSGCAILGYATFPSNTQSQGAVIASGYFGNISANLSRTATHELGHYLNLYHTFQSGCGSSCTTTGDRVCDTPPTAQENYGSAKRQNTCTNDPVPDLPDNTRNYMDYLDDAYLDLFTQAQTNRMSAALNSATGWRSSLWTSANLQATGAGPYGRVVADFWAEPRQTCPGQPISFSDYSMGKPHIFRWDIFSSGGSTSVASSTQQCPTFSLTTPGIYDVRLIVENLSGRKDTLRKSNFITIIDPSTALSLPFSEGFEATTFPPAGWLIINEDLGTTWTRYAGTNRGGFGLSNAAARLRSFTYINQGQKDHLIAPLIQIPSGGSYALNFDLLYKPFFWENLSASPKTYGYFYSDTLRVYYTTDCGVSWTLLYEKTENDLATMTPDTILNTSLAGKELLPQSAPNNDWRKETIPLPTSLAGKKVRFRFEYASGLGNNLYLDNVAINTSTSVALLDPAPALLIAPNPTQDKVEITLRDFKPGEIYWQLVDPLGRRLDGGTWHIVGSWHTQTLNLSTLPAGVYYLECYSSSFRQVRLLTKY